LICSSLHLSRHLLAPLQRVLFGLPTLRFSPRSLRVGASPHLSLALLHLRLEFLGGFVGGRAYSLDHQGSVKVEADENDCRGYQNANRDLLG